MPSLDATALAKLAVNLRLATDAQIQECCDDEGRLPTDPRALLRTLERKGYLTPFQTQKLIKGEQEGYFLGSYRLLYRIASGSFGRVFRADDPRSGTVVALKVLRRRWTSDPQKVELFEREAKLGMALRHPNIVSILTTGKDAASNQYFIVMEFVEGGNLRDFLLIRKKLGAAEALRLLEDAAAGLAYAFSRGVTHRDMKPTNILISAQGAAKLVDFGLAGISAAEPRGKDEDQVDRSVDYAGLEKATNVKPGDVRSDIYFLGCVFYEMLTGRPPLVLTKDRHARQSRERFLNVPRMAPSEVDAPPEVFELVSRMMSLEPQRRYQTPVQLLDAVREARRAADAATTAAVKPAPASSKRSVCVIARHPQLRELLEGKLISLGYAVHIEDEPAKATERYRTQPFDALIIDSAGIGPDAVAEFEQILAEARRKQRDCAGILVLAEKHASWGARVTTSERTAVLIRPLTLKQLFARFLGMMPTGN